MSTWRPSEIIVNEKVKDDPVTKHFLEECPNTPVKYVKDGKPNTVVEASKILSQSNGMLNKVLAGKQIVYIAPAAPDVVDVFEMPDLRLMCPHFNRLKLASNGCFYQCDWCYLKGTNRGMRPYITVRAQYDIIEKQLKRVLKKADSLIMFNSGEMADSLSLEHLTGAGQHFIPWFAKQEKGYLFMLTKSDNVDDILNLHHNGHTIIAFSINNEAVSQKYEIGAPPFEKRLEAAHKVQKAGYPLRLRLDPIVPFNGWKNAYANTIKRIFEVVRPERMTLGTLRFEIPFYNMRNSIFTAPDLPALVGSMKPMFDKDDKGKIGKYSFPENQRVDIFRFAIDEIRKYSDCDIALCKESADVWNKVGLDLSRCRCVCQLDYKDMTTV